MSGETGQWLDSPEGIASQALNEGTALIADLYGMELDEVEELVFRYYSEDYEMVEEKVVKELTDELGIYEEDTYVTSKAPNPLDKFIKFVGDNEQTAPKGQQEEVC